MAEVEMAVEPLGGGGELAKARRGQSGPARSAEWSAGSGGELRRADAAGQAGAGCVVAALEASGHGKAGGGDRRGSPPPPAERARASPRFWATGIGGNPLEIGESSTKYRSTGTWTVMVDPPGSQGNGLTLAVNAKTRQYSCSTACPAHTGQSIAAAARSGGDGAAQPDVFLLSTWPWIGTVNWSGGSANPAEGLAATWAACCSHRTDTSRHAKDLRTIMEVEESRSDLLKPLKLLLKPLMQDAEIIRRRSHGKGSWSLIPDVMDLRSTEITVFSGEVIPLCRRLGSRVAALGA
nr:putative protein phosphatase 2C 48 [Paspalum simplex]